MKSEEITTIKLKKTTKDRLDKLRAHKRETYDDILERTLGILNICRASPIRAQARLRILERQKRFHEKVKEK